MVTVCVTCGTQVSDKVEKFSLEKYGKVLCFDHQKPVYITRDATADPPSDPNNPPEESPRTGVQLARNLHLTMTLQGKEYITHGGLLAIAHEVGLRSIETELVSVDWEKQRAVVKAVVTTSDTGTGMVVLRRFTGLGDADPSNTSANVRNAFLRMAETRAVNRALRFATNVGLTSLEEMPGVE